MDRSRPPRRTTLGEKRAMGKRSGRSKESLEKKPRAEPDRPKAATGPPDVTAADIPERPHGPDSRTIEESPGTDTRSGPPKPKMSRKEHDRALKVLQGELVKLQEWVKATGAKICVVFEGRDAAGKGGVIKRITERTSPRVFRVVALPAPTDREKTQMYWQRYICHLPSAGEVVLFDRSWYNRAGVERVMGFATEDQAEHFLMTTPDVERAIIDSGTLLVKYWLAVNKEEQTERFKERITDPRKTWKLSEIDMESHRRWYDYSRARDAIFAATDTDESPWFVVDANDQRRARLNCISHLLSMIPYEEIPRDKAKLPRRQPSRGYKEPDYQYRFVPEEY
jgi:polyphosphate kinase 2